MPKNVQIRNVPDDVHACLRVRAVEAELSLSEYLRREICTWAERPTVSEVLTRAANRGGGRMTFVEAAEGVRADRDGA